MPWIRRCKLQSDQKVCDIIKRVEQVLQELKVSYDLILANILLSY
jgi:hypothetical protein